MDGFRTAEMLSGEQKGMRRLGPQPGMPNAADPATVLQRGFSIRSAGSGGDGSQGATGLSKTAKRKSHWGGDTISRGRTPLSLRIVRSFVSPAKPWEGEENPTAFKATTCEPGDLPSTGMVPTLGSFPRCQHGGCRGDVLHLRVREAPPMPVRIRGSCIDGFFAHVGRMRRS
jgi:hypothetical protein